MRGSERGARTMARALAAERVLALPPHHDVQRLVEDASERMRRVQAQRRQHRHDLVAEIRAQPAGLLRVPAVAAEQADAASASSGRSSSFQQRYCASTSSAARSWMRRARSPAACRRRPAAMPKSCAWRTVARGSRRTRRGWCRCTGKRSRSSRARTLVPCLRQHAEVEIQLRQFAVQVQRRVTQRRRWWTGWRGAAFMRSDPSARRMSGAVPRDASGPKAQGRCCRAHLAVDRQPGLVQVEHVLDDGQPRPVPPVRASGWWRRGRSAR